MYVCDVAMEKIGSVPIAVRSFFFLLVYPKTSTGSRENKVAVGHSI